MKILPGLVSVTFRKLTPREIVNLASRAGLAGIEWGGDVHVPHGIISRAAEVRSMTANAGLAVSAYGSYYRAGGQNGPDAFAPILETALALGAPTIRIWAGDHGSAETDADGRRRVEDDLLRIAELSAAAEISVSCEYHADTLTDTGESARALLDAVGHTSIFTFWQPPNGASVGECLASLRVALRHLSNVHVFHWWPRPADRRPLVEGASRWRHYLTEIAGAESDNQSTRFASLEFVRDDSAEQFLADARTLHEWLDEL